jgi:hypothetical protein
MTWEWVSRYMLSWPWQLLEVSGQLHALPALPPGKEPQVSIGWETGCTPELVWMMSNFLGLPKLEFCLLGRPVCSQSLHHLHSGGSQVSQEVLNLLSGLWILKKDSATGSWLEFIWKVSVKIKLTRFLWYITNLYLYIKINLSETITRR